MQAPQVRDLLHELLLQRMDAAEGVTGSTIPADHIAAVGSGGDRHIVIAFDDGTAADLLITVRPAPEGGQS